MEYSALRRPGGDAEDELDHRHAHELYYTIEHSANSPCKQAAPHKKLAQTQGTQRRSARVHIVDSAAPNPGGNTLLNLVVPCPRVLFVEAWSKAEIDKRHENEPTGGT